MVEPLSAPPAAHTHAWRHPHVSLGRRVSPCIERDDAAWPTFPPPTYRLASLRGVLSLRHQQSIFAPMDTTNLRMLYEAGWTTSIWTRTCEHA